MFRNYVTLILCSIIAAISSPAFADAAAQRPPKLLSGYFTYTLGSNNIEKIDREFFEPMQKAGFNTVEIKIQPGTNSADRLDLKKTFPELKTLVDAANKRNLFFEVYVYPEPYDGKRMSSRKEHQALPAFVNELGETVSNRFSLIHWAVWREMFANAFQFAEASRQLPIGAVKIDIETISNLGISFDDAAWREFCQAHAGLPADTPADKRNATLIKANLKDAYTDWFVRKFEETAARFEQEMHQINPKLMLGIMPTSHGWISNGFIKKMGTAQAPAIIDDWSMYNGSGFTPEIIALRDQIKKLNPYNLYIPWLRINSYMPKEIPAQVYHAVSRCDGYSNWNMYMINSEPKTMQLYKLPDKTVAADYYAAYGQANTALMTDISAHSAGEPSRIAFRKIIPLAAPLNLSQLSIPALIPDGSGTGVPQLLSMREQQTIFIYAETAKPIKVFIQHLAGSKRPIAIQYAVVDKNKNILRNEIINSGDKETFEVTAPYSGVYALVVSGGADGQAWYGVKVFNSHIAFDARKGLYLFYMAPFKIYAQRSGDGAAELDISIRSGQVYMWKSGKAQNIETAEKSAIQLSPQLISEITISKPPEVVSGKYTQDIIVLVKGAVFPFIFDGQERRLIPGDKK